MVYGQLGIGKENNLYYCLFYFFYYIYIFKFYIIPLSVFFFFKYMYILLFCCLFVIPLSVIV